jgi:hypothetical protein
VNDSVHIEHVKPHGLGPITTTALLATGVTYREAKATVPGRLTSNATQLVAAFAVKG